MIFTLNEKLLDQWDAKMEASIEAVCQQGRWELVEYRWIKYLHNEVIDEKAKVSILRVLSK